MNERRLLLPVVATVSLAISGMTFGQAPAPTITSNMVYIPVAVTGPKNVNVTGLTKDNFVLLENGIQQTLGAFYEQNQPIDIDIILAVGALQRGRSDLNSTKIREAVENFRQQGNSQNKYVVEEMPFGANGIYDAISRHVTRLSESSINPRRVVVAITDGIEASGGEPGRALQNYARKFNVPIYMVYTAPVNPNSVSDNIADIGAGPRARPVDSTSSGDRNSSVSVYEDLTKFTGGTLYFAGGSVSSAAGSDDQYTQLVPFLERFATELKSQYVLGFKSTNDARDDKWRKLEVKIKAPQGIGTLKEKDMKTKVRDRYFVAKPAKP